MAITRSMTRGNNSPPSDDSRPSDKTVARKRSVKSKAPSRRRATRQKKVDRLTALPLELFRMILDELMMDLAVSPQASMRSWLLYCRNLARMIKLSLVSKLFSAEIDDSVLRVARPITQSNLNLWHQVATIRPFMISRLLHEEVRSRPNSDIGILALIHQVVDEIIHLKNEDPKTCREGYLEAACCFAFHASCPVNMTYNLTNKTSETYRPYSRISLHQDVINNCWSVAAWMGDCSLLDILESKYGPIAQKFKMKDHPLYLGSAMWAAARNGQMDAIKYFQQKGCDFGGLKETASSILSPLCGAISGNHVQAFEAILPAYDRHRSTDTGSSRSIMREICYKIAADGSEEIARIFWTREPHVSLDVLGKALTSTCGAFKRDRIKVAEVLIEVGAPITQQTMLKAILFEEPEILQLLLQKAGIPKAYAGSVIRKAVEQNRTEAVKKLLQHCKWVEVTTHNVLLEAVFKNRLEMVKILVSPENFDPTASEQAAEFGSEAAKWARNDLKIEIWQELDARGCEQEHKTRS
ncbi:hypothetical protein IWZ01DRAFT_82896 [Phyllosticta capitalensis]